MEILKLSLCLTMGLEKFSQAQKKRHILDFSRNYIECSDSLAKTVRSYEIEDKC